MISIIRTDSNNQAIIGLVKLLDAYLAIKDGAEHSFYDQFNKIDTLKYVVLACENENPVGCGAIKAFSPGTMEIKRMFTLSERRGEGIAGKILAELESWAKELGCEKCVLETGKRQLEAIVLYKKKGYLLIPNYGQYAGMGNSLCFEKIIK